jgi:hypothetical protein
MEGCCFNIACQAYHTWGVLTSVDVLWGAPYLTHPHKPLYNPNSIQYEPAMPGTVQFVENKYDVK